MNFVPAFQPDQPPTSRAWCFGFVAGQLLLPQPALIDLAPQARAAFEALASFAQPAGAPHYLGRLDDLDCWAIGLAAVPAGWHSVPLRAALMDLPEPLAQLTGRAAQILEWDRAHRYCGVCATPTVPRDYERARACPKCGEVAYPRVSPAMMVLIWRGRELLLARSPHYAPGRYSALAGFVEAGESLEECVAREVAEEVGVRVKNLRYYGSQSWPFPHSLMVAYTAEWAAGDIVPQAGEIEAAAWFSIDTLPGIPPLFSIAGHLIRDTAAAMRERPA